MNDPLPNTGFSARALFKKIVPAAVREGVIYPVLRFARRAGGDILEHSEPARLWAEALLADLKLRSSSKAIRAIGKINPEWESRIAEVTACGDNAFIPRHPEAGHIEGAAITMHNGLKVRALSYYGEGILNMLIQNRGVHEPQEERAFAAVLPHMPRGATILELGAYWGFYSMWFVSVVPGARCFLVEPDPRNLRAGKANFRLNGLRGHFTCAAVGNPASTGLKSVRMTDVPSFCARHGIGRLNLLHSDIQGAEVDMLEGARRMLADRRIDFVFLSTHGQSRHERCAAILREEGYRILCGADMEETSSIDGLIVAKSPSAAGPDSLQISKRTSRAA